jgi:ABC-type branched-subunit amino acid transport system substrate-binding protein
VTAAPRRACGTPAGAAFVLALAIGAFAAPLEAAPPANARAADVLAGSTPLPGRDRDLARWAGRASLAELMWVLRRPASELAGAEAVLVAAALARTHDSRRDLKRRLELRLALADPRGARKRLGELADDAAVLGGHSRASAFRIAALLPDSGDYADYARAVRFGLRVAIEEANASARLPIELASFDTGDDEPHRAADALDRAAATSGSAVGDLLSVPTIALATGARMADLPLVSPTATDESIGLVGPSIVQVGPSGWQRGEAIARSVVPRRGVRVGVLTATGAARGAFARGFAAAAESLGADVAWRATFASGGRDFRAEARTVAQKRLDVLFFEGEEQEAAALVRALATDRVSVQLCGGENLHPDRHHAESRRLLEGAIGVGSDWELPRHSRARLDSLARASGQSGAHDLHIRGWLAGRMLCAAVAWGALCPEEITAYLRSTVARGPWLAARGFLDATPTGAWLPVWKVRGGRAVPLEGSGR